MGLREPPRARDLCPVSGKERLTRGKAKSLAKRLRGDVNLHAYECRSCGGWHVGNKRRITTPR